MRALLVVVLAASLGACAQLAALTDGAADRAGKAIAEYCQLPEETRIEFRAKVARHAAPHAARITCAR